MNQQNRMTWQRSAGTGLVGILLLVACGAASPSDRESGSEPTRETQVGLTGSLEIHGRVTSPTGTPISGVTLTLSGAASKTATSDAAGKYTFTALASGAYTIVPKKTGLKFCSTSASIPMLRLDAVEDFAGSTAGCQTPVYQRKAAVLIFDPNITKPDGTVVKLSAYQNWEDPAGLADRYRRSMESITNGRVKFTIAKSKTINDFPVKLDGFDYTQASYLACVADHSTCHDVDTPDLLSILNAQGVCNDLNAGTIDELWLFGGPWFGFYESQLTGPKAFWYNSPVLAGSSCNKLLPMMGFNYERSVNEMVHDTIHRTEATMSRVYGSWAENRLANNFDRFGLIAAQSPSFNFSGCGSAHWAPTSSGEYEYDNPNPVASFCDDFFNYPNLKAPASALKTITCAAWGCDELAFYRYFFQHLPKATGTGPDGKFNDWWRYVVNPNDVFLTDSVTCSSEYDGGWCQRVVDGVKGTCNVGEWATAGLPTGWAKITWPSARSVSSVTLFDRACDEQVLAGHLEFSNGSPNIAFGALENTGTTGTKLSFATKSLTWLKVVIDQSAGGNPGISEVVVQ